MEPLGKLGNDLLTVVFDGKRRTSEDFETQGDGPYSIIYSSSVDGADGVIEKMLMNTKHPERIVVVTNETDTELCLRKWLYGDASENFQKVGSCHRKFKFDPE